MIENILLKFNMYLAKFNYLEISEVIPEDSK